MSHELFTYNLISKPKLQDAELIRLLFLTGYLTLSDVKTWCDKLIELSEVPSIKIIDLAFENDYRSANSLLLKMSSREESIYSFKIFIEFLRNQKFDTEKKVKHIISKLLPIHFPYIKDDIESTLDGMVDMFNDIIADVYPYPLDDIGQILPDWFELCDDFEFLE